MKMIQCVALAAAVCITQLYAEDTNEGAVVTAVDDMQEVEAVAVAASSGTLNETQQRQRKQVAPQPQRGGQPLEAYGGPNAQTGLSETQRMAPADQSRGQGSPVPGSGQARAKGK